MRLKHKIVYAVLFLATFLSLSRLFAASTRNVPSSTYPTIQSAIDAADPGDTINVAMGNYTGRIIIGNNIKGFPLDNITLEGAGAGVTFLNISGTRGTAITFDNVSGSTVRGFTIKNADIGIKAVNSKANITNNIFIRNKSAFENSSSFSRVINNTFYRNTRAVFTNSSSTLKNNIFAGSDRYGVVGSKAGSIAYNLFHNNVLGNFSGIDTPPDSSLNVVGDPDPLFVNYTSDFHLRVSSPAIKRGDPFFNNMTSDIGVYGGPDADVKPATVKGVAAVSSKTAVTISWDKNLAYNIADHRVYYGKSFGNHTSSFVPTGNSSESVFTNLSTNQKYYFAVRAVDENDHKSDFSEAVTGAIDTSPPSAPANLRAGIGDKRLFLAWDAATDNESGINGYKVYYGTSSGSYLSPLDTGNQASYELSGLTNGVTYYIAVSAVDMAGNEGPKSSEVLQTPVEIRGILGLKSSGGCFIATAAYGSYEEKHVKILREFRDRYLLTNIPGRAFVRLYYKVSPPVAAVIRDSEALKALVRAALLPLIAFSWLVLNQPLLTVAVITIVTIGGIMGISHVRAWPTPALDGQPHGLPLRKRLTSYVSLLTLFLLLMMPTMSFGGERSGPTLGLTYGQLEPSSDEWKEIYDDDRVSTYRVFLGYRFHPTISAEIGAGYLTKDGKGKTITGSETGVKTTFQEAPVDLTLIYRLNYFDEQLIVPYIGGGVSYNYYWEKVKDGKDLKGGMRGYHATAGLQILMDYIDRTNSVDLEEDYGVESTYLTIGATHSVIDDFGKEDVDLGGWNYNVGLLFEF